MKSILENKTKIGFSLFLFFLPVFLIHAYEIRDTETEFNNDFVLEPAKVEVFLDPGTSESKDLNILNRTDKTMEFKIEIEDFSGSKDPNQTVVLSGEERGPYSLKDYLNPELQTFTLKPGQKITFPVIVSIPLDAEPGGLYGSVLISSEATAKGTGTSIVSRLGALFFVNVNGEVKREGKLISFVRKETESGSNFELLFENTGNAHLNPYGFIYVYNIMGTKVAELEVQSYFAMPDSVRLRELAWDENNHKLFGKYKAVAKINRGYDDLVDEMTYEFWVIPVKVIVTTGGILLLLILIITWLVRTFDFNITKDKGNNASSPEDSTDLPKQESGSIESIAKQDSQNSENPPSSQSL
ncbi:MAG: hypothetical protein V1851_01570 [Patescibacteria group bacterium]